MVKNILRGLGGLMISTVVAYIVASILNTQFVIVAHNVPVSFGDRINMTAFDLSNMYLYMVVILVGFVIGFAVAALVKKILPRLARFAYPVAGAAALGVILGLMYWQFQTLPISGARSALGFASQVLAGGVGGWVFAKIVARGKMAI